MWPFTSKPKPVRSAIDGATVRALLNAALSGSKAANYRHISQKDTLSVVLPADIEAAAKKAFMPWQKDVWECEDQARALVHEAQKMAANEGRSWAVGTLRADDPTKASGLHVLVWAVALLPGRFAERAVICYDATAQKWRGISTLTGVDYTLT